jgi:hypothetical protein
VWQPCFNAEVLYLLTRDGDEGCCCRKKRDVEGDSTSRGGGVVGVIVKVEASGFAVKQKRVTVGCASSGSQLNRSYLLYHLTTACHLPHHYLLRSYDTDNLHWIRPNQKMMEAFDDYLHMGYIIWTRGRRVVG